MKTLSVLAVISVLASPLVAPGQTTVFSDNFGSSTLNPTAASPGTQTATRSAYEIASAKSATSTTIASSTLTLNTASTGSGFTEAQAKFAATPVTLSAPGHYIEVYFTFKDTANIFNGSAAANATIDVGLFNSGGSAPTNGTALWNSGISSSLTTADTGGSMNWLGYVGNIAYGFSSAVTTRPAQTQANNTDQEVLYSSTYAGGTNIAILGNPGTGLPALTTGSTYTLAFQITYSNSLQYVTTVTLYNGAGLAGSVIESYSALGSNNVLTTSFDSLAVGYRATSSAVTTIPISNITVLDFIPALPTIAALTNQTVIAGSNTTLNPTITGVPAPALQWATNGVNIAGATSSPLVLNNVQYSQNGYVYSLIATNSVGVVSNAMTLNVIVPPAITGLGNQAGSVGSTITISPTVSGVPAPVLQWQTNGVNVGDGVDANGSTISGSATSSLSIANAQAADSGMYSLIASNSAGIVTNSMILTVSAGNILPLITGPANQTVIQGNNATFSASVSGLPTPALQWLDQTQTPILNATNSALTLNNVQFSQNGYTYYLVASNSVGSVTNSATLTVTIPPVITSQPASVTATNTQSASFTVVAMGVPNPTYQWFSNNVPVSASLNNSATNATFTLASVSPVGSGSSYYVQVSNSAGITNSATVTLTVNSAMAVASLTPANAATGICYDTPLYLTFSQAPTLKNAGTIRIFNVNNSTTPVDTIDLGLSVTPNASAKNVQPRNIGGDTFTNYPVVISGNQAVIYPHLDLLTSNQTYYITVDNGTFADSAGANFAGITATNLWQFTTKTGGPANPTNTVVAGDGSGDFATVQGAVDAVPANNTTPTRINIKNGNYFEIVNVKSKHDITLRGQSRTGTIVGYANNANLQSSTHFRMAMKINANDIALDNLTVTNRTVAGGSQAEALMLESKALRFILNNCDVASFQDTFLANGGGQSQAYLNNSLIIGQFDYVWGGGVCFFTNCELRTVFGSGSSWNLVATRTDNSTAGNWPAYNGDISSNGFSFVNCYLSKVTGVGIGNPTLADSNGTSNGVAAWINCRIQKDYVAPAAAMEGSELLWEYNNTNNDTGLPVTYGLAVGDSAPALTSTDPRLLAADSATNWLNGWQPQLAPNILTNPVALTVTSGSPATFTVTATGIPDPTYQWQQNGTNVAGATAATLTIPAAVPTNGGNYSVVVTTTAGTVTSSPALLTVNPSSNTAPVFTAPINGTNFTINVGVNLAVACTATDSDVPAQTLTYSLLNGPAGSALNSSSGSFTWRPTVAQSGLSTNVTVAVTDNGTPNLSATNSFNVSVISLVSPAVSSPTHAGGQFSVSVSGQVGPDYELQTTTNLLTWKPVATTNSPMTMPFILTDTNAAQPMQFYRIVAGPPLP